MIPQHIKQKLRELKTIANPTYYKDRLDVCKLIYKEDATAAYIKANIDKWSCFRIMHYQRDFIDKSVLGEEKVDTLQEIYEDILERD